MSCEVVRRVEEFLLEAVELAIPGRAWERGGGRAPHLRRCSMSLRAEGFQACLVLGVSDPYLQKSCPGFQPGISDPDIYLGDWLCELCNLVLGRLQSSMAPFGVTLTFDTPLSLPKVDTLSEISAALPDHVQLLWHDGVDFLQIDFWASGLESLNLQKTKNQEMTKLQPGDVIYQLKDSEWPIVMIDPIAEARSGNDSESGESLMDDLDEDLDLSWDESMFGAARGKDVFFRSPHERNTKVPVRSELPTVGINVGQDGRKPLTAIDWRDDGELLISFGEMVQYNIQPEKVLAEQNEVSFALEGYTILVRNDETLISVILPDFHLTLRRFRKSAAS